MGVEGEAPRSQIYTDSLQLSNAFLRRFVAQSVHHLPYSLQKKTSDLCESHNPTWRGQGGHVPTRGLPVPTRGYATARQLCLLCQCPLFAFGIFIQTSVGGIPQQYFCCLLIVNVCIIVLSHHLFIYSQNDSRPTLIQEFAS